MANLFVSNKSTSTRSSRATQLLYGVGLAALLVGSEAQAQSIPAATETNQQGDTGGLGDIVVTAQRRSENVQSIPASIAAADGAQLEAKSVKSVYDLKLVSPSVSISAPLGEGGAPLYSIRGVGAGDYLLNQSRPVPTYLNDAVRTLGGFDFVPLYDVERVEVLQGPQGALYGKNAVGGAVNIITTEPGFKPEGYVTLGYGNYDRREMRAAGQVAIIDDILAIRGAVSVVKANGWVKNSVANVPNKEALDIFSGRLSILFKPSPDFKAVLRIHRTTSDGTGTNVFPVNDGLIGLYIQGATPRTAATPFFNEDTELAGQGQKIRNTGLNLKLEYNLSGVTLTSITGYDTGSVLSRNDDDTTSSPASDDIYSSPNMKAFTQELRAQSAGNGPLKWIVGGQYTWDRTDILYDFKFNFDGTFGYYFNNFDNFTQTRESYALFGRGEYEFGGGFSAFAGVRYSHDSVQGRNLNVVTTSSFGDSSFSGISNGVTSSNTSFEGGINFKPMERVMLYGSFKQGYRGPALNSQVAFDPAEFSAAKPEKLDAFEIGAKTELVRGLRVNVALFDYTYKDQQYFGQAPSAGPGSPLISQLSNVGTTRIKGVDWLIEAAPITAVTLSFSGSYLDAKYRNTIINTIDVSGNQAIYTPKLSLNGGLDIRAIENGSGSLRLHADVAYQSRVFFTANNTVFVQDDGHTLVNGRLAWTSDGDKWSIGAWIKNAFNEKYFVQGFETAGSFGFDTLYRGAPRTFGADLTFRF